MVLFNPEPIKNKVTVRPILETETTKGAIKAVCGT
jgi:hypothetical protein